MLALGSLLLGIAKGAEPYFIGGFIALLTCVIAAWLTRYRLIQSANEQSRQAAQAQPISTAIHSVEAETQNVAVGPPMPILLSAHPPESLAIEPLPETNSSQRQEAETASRYFNLFNPQRPMIDLPDDRGGLRWARYLRFKNKQLRLKFLPDTRDKEGRHAALAPLWIPSNLRSQEGRSMRSSNRGFVCRAVVSAFHLRRRLTSCLDSYAMIVFSLMNWLNHGI